MNITWTDARIARLTELWGHGVSARLIAVDMGIGKSAVIGKSYRLELERRASPIRHGGPAPKKEALAQATHAIPNVHPSNKNRMPGGMPKMPRAGSGARGRTCQFIAGEPSADDACKCGEPVQDSPVYCRKHNVRCHLKREPRRAA